MVCSQHLALLTPVLESLRALLFPFEWHMPYIPVLFGEKARLMESPFNYLFGFYGLLELILERHYFVASRAPQLYMYLA